MSITVLCGSPKKGSSFRISTNLSQLLLENKRPHEVFNLCEKKLQLCNGCLLCEDEGYCPLNDDMHQICNALLLSDTIIIVTPVFFDNIPAILKNCLDRMNLMCNQLSEKKLFLVTVGQADQVSWDACNNIIKNYCGIMSMEYLGQINLYARKPNDLTTDQVLDCCKKIMDII